LLSLRAAGLEEDTMKTLLILCAALALPLASGCRKKEETYKKGRETETTGKPVEAPGAEQPSAPSGTAPAPGATTAPSGEREGKMGRNRVEATYETWDIGEAMQKAQKEPGGQRPSTAANVVAPAATIPGAPAAYANTRFVTVRQARRLSGETRLMMPESLARELASTGEREMEYRGRVCADAQGKPLFVQPIERTRVPAADHEVERTVMSWRFAPHTTNGKAQPFCTGVRYRFKLIEGKE
jgi:hypothetical protein